jgi:hypothetical protein
LSRDSQTQPPQRGSIAAEKSRIHAGGWTNWRTDETAVTTNKLAPKLEKITSKGLDKADQILDLPLDPDSETFGPTLRAQTSIVGQALTTQVRVDENQMRAE